MSKTEALRAALQKVVDDLQLDAVACQEIGPGPIQLLVVTGPTEAGRKLSAQICAAGNEPSFQGAVAMLNEACTVLGTVGGVAPYGGVVVAGMRAGEPPHVAVAGSLSKEDRRALAGVLLGDPPASAGGRN